MCTLVKYLRGIDNCLICVFNIHTTSAHGIVDVLLVLTTFVRLHQLACMHMTLRSVCHPRFACVPHAVCVCK